MIITEILPINEEKEIFGFKLNIIRRLKGGVYGNLVPPDKVSVLPCKNVICLNGVLTFFENEMYAIYVLSNTAIPDCYDKIFNQVDFQLKIEKKKMIYLNTSIQYSILKENNLLKWFEKPYHNVREQLLWVRIRDDDGYNKQEYFNFGQSILKDLSEVENIMNQFSSGFLKREESIDKIVNQLWYLFDIKKI